MTLRETFESIIYNGLESLGRYYSSYRGYVIENDDPLKMNRIQVNIPSVTRHLPHPSWAYPKGGFAGKDYGLQVLPLKGDVVWIEFDHGDTKYPIWHHGHYTKGELPEEFETAQVYGFKTPSGQVVLIDDREGTEKIVIRAKNHMIIESETISLESGSIIMKGDLIGTPRFNIGANGAFSSIDGRIVKVSGGLITEIT